MSQQSSCHVMVKPTGSVCNIDCDYCFYLEKEHLYPERNKDYKMSFETLEIYIKQQIEAQDTPEVVFSWQGGEPTLMGIDFFKHAVELVKKHNVEGKKVIHTLQTNGLLINDEWCQFFKENEFLIGVSIDGPQYLHDVYRVTRSGKPTHKKVMEAIECLKTFQVEFNTLTVVNNINVEKPLELYQFLKEIGSRNMQFIPLVERKSKQPNKDGLYLIDPDYDQAADITPHSVNPDKFGLFLNTVFGDWLINDVGDIYIQFFEHTLAKWAGESSNLCHFAEECGSAFAMESNGDVYSCDHYVYSEHKLGNIYTQTIKDINLSERNKKFGSDKSKLCSDCNNCKYKFLCNGGCPKYRILSTFDGDFKKNYLCSAYKKFFKHSEPYMVAMYELIKKGLPAETIKKLL
ncbi:anaerobic sulfatase maturase [Vibrio parahaemolyticus]|nr:anaerobic sulfatase maturase [Vibrio parahaemolyticus]EIZ1552142.1 anaerobic sulfatase maturase [Vibrio parahaemolyticus]